MLTSLDWLVIVFMILVAASLLSLSLMFLARRPHIKRVCFYIVAALGLFVAYAGIRIGLGFFPVQTSIGVIVGIASIAAIVLEHTFKKEKKCKLAHILASVSLVIGVFNAIL